VWDDCVQFPWKVLNWTGVNGVFFLDGWMDGEIGASLLRHTLGWMDGWWKENGYQHVIIRYGARGS